jgi:hypothetical protein
VDKELMQSWLDFFLSPSFWQGVGGSLIGALTGGLFVLWAQKGANHAQRKRDRISKAEALQSTLKAIKTELEVYLDKNLEAVAQEFHRRQLPEEVLLRKNPLAMAPIAQNPFIIFQSNTGLIGGLPNDALRKMIVVVYGEGRAFIDMLNFNYRRVEAWNESSRRHHDLDPTCSVVPGLDRLRIRLTAQDAGKAGQPFRFAATSLSRPNETELSHRWRRRALQTSRTLS